MKCDDCKYNTGYVLEADECGSGNYFSYCAKSHWNDSGAESEEEHLRQINEKDPWKDCKDYEEKL